LQDYANIGLKKATTINPDHLQSEDLGAFEETEVTAKQNWAYVQAKDANLDEGRIFFEENDTVSTTAHVSRIVEAAHLGHWVLVCPIAFPHYFGKLVEKLDHMRSAGQISASFRLMMDL